MIRRALELDIALDARRTAIYQRILLSDIENRLEKYRSTTWRGRPRLLGPLSRMETDVRARMSISLSPFYLVYFTGFLPSTATLP